MESVQSNIQIDTLYTSTLSHI